MEKRAEPTAGGQVLSARGTEEFTEQPSVTKQREREACADVPEDVPQSEDVGEKGSGESRESPPETQEGRGRVHARSMPRSPS